MKISVLVKKKISHINLILYKFFYVFITHILKIFLKLLCHVFFQVGEKFLILNILPYMLKYFLINHKMNNKYSSKVKHNFIKFHPRKFENSWYKKVIFFVEIFTFYRRKRPISSMKLNNNCY
jgi:hypothetical protein